MTSIIKVDEIQTTSGSGFVKPMAGSIIQIQYDQYTGTDTQSLSAQTDTEVNNLSVTITPTSTSSIIKLEAQVFFEYGDNNEYDHIFFFYRGTTKLGQAAAGSRNVGISQGTNAYSATDASTTPNVLHMTFFDEPSTTSATSYKVGTNFYNASTLYINRTVNDGSAANIERGVSFISATEIAG